MITLLLIIIYLAFISLGLPDAVLGAAWPVMQPELGVPYGFAGIVPVFYAAWTIVSSLFSGVLIKRLGTAKLTTLSVALTALGLFGFSVAPSFVYLLAFAVPLGLGAGSVDAALNAYVANHYESRHMSWLHCFWGLGAMSGPLVLSAILFAGYSWRSGYKILGSFQVVLVIILFISIPLWSKVKAKKSDTSVPKNDERITLISALKIRGVKMAMLVFLFYCGIENNMFLWMGSYLYKVKGMEPPLAASWVSIFLASLTAGRFLTGFVTYKMSNNRIILIGMISVLIGVILMIIPLSLIFTLAGILFIGLGCAPIFPCMLHETPAHFGSSAAQSIMGFQMASAYIGVTFLPPSIGFVTSHFSMKIFPWFIFVFACFLLSSFLALKKETGTADTKFI